MSISGSSSPIPHLIWREGTWKVRHNMKTPMVQIKYKLSEEGYKKLGSPLPLRRGASLQTVPVVGFMEAMADTGCTTMVAGLEFIHNLGLAKGDLLPVRTQVKAANKTSIKILGAVVVEVKVDGPNRDGVSKQVVYVTDSTDKVYLSLEACVQLGLVQQSFPHQPSDGPGDYVCDIASSCDCPVRSKPPPIPDQLPFPPQEKGKLKDWLLARYASSTFNICEHQQLPTMSGEPLQLFVDPNVKPHAVHMPAPIPIHFHQEVKAGIDREVRLGVIKRVPQNTPVTWCSRMVIATKADGTPRRTVDLQALNAASLRQTHHTRNPYHLVCEIPADSENYL